MDTKRYAVTQFRPLLRYTESLRQVVIHVLALTSL